jgi:hypothetical protein
MNTTSFLLTLMNIELSLLICKAKLTLCTEESDLDSASEAWQMAYDCGMQYENAKDLFILSDYSEIVYELISSIEDLYRSSSAYLISGFKDGCSDVHVGKMEIDEDDIRIVSESDWILQDDCITETKRLIGFNGVGYCFGYLDGWPDSRPQWNDNSYLNEEDARLGRLVHEEEVYQQSLIRESEVDDLSQLTDILF